MKEGQPPGETAPGKACARCAGLGDDFEPGCVPVTCPAAHLTGEKTASSLLSRLQRPRNSVSCVSQ